MQIDVDATAVSQAGIGASYLQNIIAQETSSYLQRNEGTTSLPINLVIRTAFNPNRTSEWFLSIMAVINFITMLAIVLTGSALIREREHGTVEHLLVMPVRPAEIMIAKIWANGLVIVVAAALSLWFVCHGVLRVPLAGSMPLFLAGTVLYQFSVGALGILLATFAGTMGQFGLLMIPALIILSCCPAAPRRTKACRSGYKMRWNSRPLRISSALPRPCSIGAPVSTSSGAISLRLPPLRPCSSASR